MGAAADARFAAAWDALARAEQLSAGCRATGEALLKAYREPHRRYHGVDHVVFLLDEIDRRSAVVSDAGLLRLAAFFHDAIYDVARRDNEERSAAWAQQDLAALGARPERVAAVAALVLKTKSHHAGEASSDEALFLDMDFAILGAPADIYRAYADAIRAEYAAVPEDAFREGRSAFLQGVLKQSRMFRTGHYESELGNAARANIAAEIARLAGRA